MSDPAVTPFHSGEVRAQARAGVAQRMGEIGRRVIRDFMPDQHRELFAELPFLVVGSLDARDRPWASIVAGPVGFVASPEPRTLEVRGRPIPGDPLAANLREGAPLGVLGIQLETRRRNRMNGRVARVSESGFAIAVEQSFGNCPQYIQARAPLSGAERAPGAVRREGRRLSEAAAAVIRAADTLFIASASAAARDAGGTGEGVDVSHRGGRPGFVHVGAEGDRTVLSMPDFRGNFLFNTIGNLLVNPRAGLAVLDFASGDLVLVTGTAEIVWDGPEVAAFAGAQRLVRVAVEEGVHLERAVALRWSEPEPAPEVAATGRWDAARRAG